MNGLQSKVALVTGGCSGIGLAIVRRFIREGADVLVIDRQDFPSDPSSEDALRGPKVLRGDVSSSKELDQCFAEIAASNVRIDILVTCAGVLELATIESATLEHFNRLFDTNVKGAFLTVQKALPAMNREASIVLVTSGLHTKGVPEYGVYASTKAALRSFARTWASELRGRGIRVNTLSPGPTETPMLDSLYPDAEQTRAVKSAFASMSLRGRLALPDEVATAALFLASDDSGFCTGSDLVADGGISQI
ncbi:SDR family NAD(P)-dependent oxidoreductase [Paraburkholderia fungorum]|uniref:SDR family NAD(P)-dependent oxidoreductase n=1 Tax=Paraburkholderia fungorum TaxID=134537 RepID=UPI00402BEA10